MNKVEFIKMLKQDNETQTEPNKSIHEQVIDCAIIALIDEDADFEIDATITADKLFKLIESEAKKSKKNCIGPFEAACLIAEHLKTKNDGVARLNKLALGMLEGNNPTPRRAATISLDDI